MVQQLVSIFEFGVRLIPVWLILASAAGIGGCGTANGTADSTDSKAKTHEFSHVLPPVFTDDTPAVEFSIPVTNDTPREIQFDVVASSCSCTKSQLEKTLLGAGESTVLNGRIAFLREVGPKSVRILLRNGDSPAWAYDVRTQCYRKVVLPLNGMLSFGEVDALGTYQKSIPLTTYAPPGQPPLTLVNATCSDDRIGVGIANAAVERLADGVSCNKATLNVSLNAVPRAMIDSAVIDVVTRQGELESHEKISIHWQLSAVFSVDPPRVFFRKTDDSPTPMEKHVAISRKDGQPFAIKSISGADESFEVRVLPMGASATNVEIVVAVSSRPDRNVWSKLCLETDAADQQKIYIPLSGLFQSGAAQ